MIIQLTKFSVSSVFACRGLHISEVHWPCEFWVVLVWRYCAFRQCLFTNNGVLSPISKRSPRGLGKKHCLAFNWPIVATQKPILRHTRAPPFGFNALHVIQLNFLGCLLPPNHWSSQKLKRYGCHWQFLSQKWRESMVNVFLLKCSYLSQSRRLLSEILCWNGGCEKPVASSDGWMCSDRKSLSGPLYIKTMRAALGEVEACP